MGRGGFPSPSPPAIAPSGAPHPVAHVRRLRTALPGGGFGAPRIYRLAYSLEWCDKGDPGASPGRRKP